MAGRQVSLSINKQAPELAQIHVHRVGDASQPSHPVLSPSPLPSIFPSIRVFSNESALHIRWPSIGVSASASVLPMNIQDWSPLGWTGWISLQSKGLSRVFSKHQRSKASILRHSAFFIVQLSHPYMTTGKTIALTRRTFVSKVMSQLFNTLCLSLVKNLPAMWETRLRFLGQEDPLEKGMTTHSSILAWRIPWTEKPGGLQSIESQRVGHDWAIITLGLSKLSFQGASIF